MEYIYNKNVRSNYYGNLYLSIILIAIEAAFIICAIYIKELLICCLIMAPFLPICLIIIYADKRMYFRKATINGNIITVYYGEKAVNFMDLSKVRKSSLKVLVPFGRGYTEYDFIVLHNESPLVKNKMKLYGFKKELIYINNPQLIEAINIYYGK